MPATETKPPALDNAAALRLLKRAGACEEAMHWAREAGADGPTLWATCPRGDWMLFVAAKLGVDRRLVVAGACKCARLALRHVPAGEGRPRIAIETAERWCRGEATIAEVRKAADAADAAYADAADAAYAAGAAYAVAADAAAYAAYAYADAAGAGARLRAREKTLAECAAIVREAIPYESLPVD